MSNQYTTRKLVLIAGILTIGLLAAALTGSQVMNARGQTSNEEQKLVTTMDDVNCSEDVSLVHCVEGPIHQGENGTRTASNDSEQVVTSIDDIDCAENPSLVHCVDGNQSTVSTSGTATTKVQPDKFTVTVGVETNGLTAEEASSRNANVTADVIAALRALGISEDNMSTSSYNLYPIYETKIPSCASPSGCEQSLILRGYKAFNSIGITLDADGDIAAGKVIGTAIEGGANTVNDAFFFLSQERQQQIQDELVGEAVANARHRADIAANAVNMHVSGIHSISLNDVFFPVFSEELQAADTQILPGEQEVTMSVTVVYFMSSNGEPDGEDDASARAVALAREFILSKLPSLGIHIDDELDLHTDMVVAHTETEYTVNFSVLDQNGQSHDGFVEISNGEVMLAEMDGESLLPEQQLPSSSLPDNIIRIGKSKAISITNADSSFGETFHKAILTVDSVTVYKEKHPSENISEKPGFVTLFFNYTIRNIDEAAYYAQVDIEAISGGSGYPYQLVSGAMGELLLPGESRGSWIAIQVPEDSENVIFEIRDSRTQNNQWDLEVNLQQQ